MQNESSMWTEQTKRIYWRLVKSIWIAEAETDLSDIPHDFR